MIRFSSLRARLVGTVFLAVAPAGVLTYFLLKTAGTELDYPWILLAGVIGFVALGAAWWPLAMARELDDAILMLRTNELQVGTWLLKTQGLAAAVLAVDQSMAAHAAHWFVRETIGMLRRTLARLCRL